MAGRFWRLILAFLAWPILFSDGSSCELSTNWQGRWFHSGFAEPLVITPNEITQKGTCVYRSKNMFLMKESDPALGQCHRCMVIYEKHFNVLQYKESYCEENFDSMESLCHTITGDAPLYTMFRKDGALVKCPFRGPFSFSYAKGDSGQVCEYPASFMDTCSDNKRLQLRYQACLDVEGSEIAKEEMACLATWKEGSSRYLVSMMNHSHVHTDEARYRCFVYKRQQGARQVTYKVALSPFASCLGLWNVNEGHKTFTLRKLESDKDKCSLPKFLSRHHDWHSVDGRVIFHVNKRGHSLRMRNHTQLASVYGFDTRPYHESHVTCHKVHRDAAGAPGVRLVAHTKSGCDSGFVCLVFYSHNKNIIQMRYGDQSRDPAEACMNYYFDARSSPLITLVAGGRGTQACPFSGRYTLAGGSLSQLLGGQLNCQSAEMHAGCSTSDDLIVESSCQGGTRTRWSCHGQWASADDQQTLVLSTPIPESAANFVCLTYRDTEGILTASVAMDSCHGHDLDGRKALFNITSSGACLQALTSGTINIKARLVFTFVLAVAVSSLNLLACL